MANKRVDDGAKPADPSDAPAVDPLADALQYLRMGGVFYCPSELTSPWGLELPPMDNALLFHAVTSGDALLMLPSSDDPIELRQGDFVLMPHGTGHCLASDNKAPTPSIYDLPHDEITEQYAILRHGAGGDKATLTCGAVSFGHPAAKTLISLLPEVVHLRAPGPELDWLAGTLGLLAAETASVRPGSEAVVTRLCDILVIQAVRTWIATDSGATTGWLGALQDPKIGRALALIHRSPGSEFTVAGLASEVAMSRSAFSAEFTDLVGESVMQYITRWRMMVAFDLLSRQRESVTSVACQLGYQSEASFSRAFKRVVGMSPGAVRRSAS